MTDQLNLQTLSVDGSRLRYAAFRYIWLTSVLFSVGYPNSRRWRGLCSGRDDVVGREGRAGADGDDLADDADRTAHGAIADIIDRRLVALIALLITLCGVTAPVS
ncbi:hypothetical protein [Bradyrhizobium brasilense]|uniref:hypothetical protein n=1 Tax=Bradyrhizobium brasilense TaxID=1419277 RepID=UPI0028775E23|nr:hypothetical protein [Bradyrhizobium brasilense]